MQILVVDDDKKICDILGRYFDGTEFDAVFVNSGKEAEEQLKQKSYALVVFDVMLPDANGFDLLGNLRDGMYFNNSASTDRDVPAIMLTALGQTNHVIKGLKIGADDYIAKPFDPNELLERIKCIVKRAYKLPDDQTVMNNLSINRTNHQVKCKGALLELQRREYDLLTYLCQNPEQVFSRDQLIENIWGLDYQGGDRAVDVCITRLRDKLKTAGAEVEIKTLWGKGYCLKKSL